MLRLVVGDRVYRWVDEEEGYESPPYPRKHMLDELDRLRCEVGDLRPLQEIALPVVDEDGK